MAVPAAYPIAAQRLPRACETPDRLTAARNLLKFAEVPNWHLSASVRSAPAAGSSANIAQVSKIMLSVNNAVYNHGLI
jgi:hypothetical protein